MADTKVGHSDKRRVRFVKFKGHSIIIDGKKVAINPATDRPYVVWFVNNTNIGGGVGTFKDPFSTLVAAQVASGPNDIIYIFPGTGTDKGQAVGIAPQAGQDLLGAGFSYQIETTRGTVKIPAQAKGLPTISNTNSTFDSTRFNAVFMQFGDNTVAGLNCVDNIGGNSLASGVDVSGAIRIDNGTHYNIQHNTMSTFTNVSKPFPGGSCLIVFGGGGVVTSNNTYVARDGGSLSPSGVCDGFFMFPLINPHQGSFVVEESLFTGLDNNSGFDNGVTVFTGASIGAGAIGNIKVSIEKNTFNSQKNVAMVSPAGAAFLTFPGVSNPVTLEIIGNKVTIPAGLLGTEAGIAISAFGPGPTMASLHENSVLTTPPVPGYLFDDNGVAADLILDVGFDNFGTSALAADFALKARRLGGKIAVKQ